MKLYKLQLELIDLTELEFATWLYHRGNRILVTKTDITTPCGFYEYILISTKDILLEFLDRFYDSDEEFFNLYAELV